VFAEERVTNMTRPILVSLGIVAIVLSAACGASDVPKPPKLDQWAVYDSDDQTIVKKSREGVCHDYKSGSFARTTHYIAYRTMEDCMASGGRAPK
jgi:hypothetical protein